MNLLKKFSMALGAILAGFVTVSITSGNGGLAQLQMREAWVYPIHPLFSSMSYRSMTEQTVEAIFRDHLKGVKKGRESELARHLVRECRKHRLDPAYVLSVIQVESGFRAQVRSYAGALGLLQLMPDTAHYVARKNGMKYRGKESLKDPFINLTLGIAYLAELRDRYKGLSPYFQLAAYNMGPARLDQLRARPDFKPTTTLKYYEDVMRGVDRWRYYSSRKAELAARKLLMRGKRSKLTQLVEKRERSI